MSPEFAIMWIARDLRSIDMQFRNNPCEVKVTRALANRQSVNVYLILPAGPTRKRAAYNRVLNVAWPRDWIVIANQEVTIRGIIDLIPIRLGVHITTINWWGNQRKEVIDEEAAAA